MTVNFILTSTSLPKLILEHGVVTHYTVEEGGVWWPLKICNIKTIILLAPHALRFQDGREWDEINGIRPIDSQD